MTKTPGWPADLASWKAPWGRITLGIVPPASQDPSVTWVPKSWLRPQPGYFFFSNIFYFWLPLAGDFNTVLLGIPFGFLEAERMLSL